MHQIPNLSNHTPKASSCYKLHDWIVAFRRRLWRAQTAFSQLTRARDSNSDANVCAWSFERRVTLRVSCDSIRGMCSWTMLLGENPEEKDGSGRANHSQQSWPCLAHDTGCQNLIWFRARSVAKVSDWMWTESPAERTRPFSIWHASVALRVAQTCAVQSLQIQIRSFELLI